MGTHALALASSAAASLLLPFHKPPRPPQLEHASRQPLSRRSLFGLGTAAAAAAAFSGSVQAAGNPLPLPPAAVVLQVADNTVAMQGMMIQSVKDMDELTDQQRKDVGCAVVAPCGRPGMSFVGTAKHLVDSRTVATTRPLGASRHARAWLEPRLVHAWT